MHSHAVRVCQEIVARRKLAHALEQGAIAIGVPIGQVSAQPLGIYLRRQIGANMAVDATYASPLHSIKRLS